MAERQRVAETERPEGGLGCRSAPPEGRSVGGQGACKGGSGRKASKEADRTGSPQGGEGRSREAAGGMWWKPGFPQGGSGGSGGKLAGESGSAARWTKVARLESPRWRASEPRGELVGCRDPQGPEQPELESPSGWTGNAGPLEGVDRSKEVEARVPARGFWWKQPEVGELWKAEGREASGCTLGYRRGLRVYAPGASFYFWISLEK